MYQGNQGGWESWDDGKGDAPYIGKVTGQIFKLSWRLESFSSQQGKPVEMRRVNLPRSYPVNMQ